MSLKDLHRTASLTDDAYFNLKQEVDEQSTEMKLAAAAKIKLFLDSIYGSDLRALHAAKVAANVAVTEEKERLALSGKNAPHPLGTKLVKMKPGKWGAPATEVCFGIMEACTRETVFAGNLRYSQPSVGAYFVRLLNNDGTPSKRVETSLWNWKVAK